MAANRYITSSPWQTVTLLQTFLLPQNVSEMSPPWKFLKGKKKKKNQMRPHRLYVRTWEWTRSHLNLPVQIFLRVIHPSIHRLQSSTNKNRQLTNISHIYLHRTALAPLLKMICLISWRCWKDPPQFVIPHQRLYQNICPCFKRIS